MNKQTKILLGVGTLAVVGYFVWKNNKPAKANATGRKSSLITSKMKEVNCGRSEVKTVTSNGYTYCQRQDSTYRLFDPNGTEVNIK